MNTNGTRTLAIRFALVLLVASLPYAFGWLTVPPDRAYVGLMADVPDHAQYWAWVTASERSLFISNTLTPEPNAPVFVNAWMYLLAQLRRLSGLSFPALFQLWRIASTFLLVSGLHVFSRTVATRPRTQDLVFWVSLLASGFGWVLVLYKKLGGLADVPFPNDVYLFETNSWWAVFAYPYVALAQGLLIWTFTGVLWSERGDRARGAAVAIASALGVAAFHAYDLISVYAVLCTYVLVEIVRLRAWPWRLIALTAAIGFLTAPIALYYQLLTLNDPLWQSILSQYANAGVVTPPGLHLVILVGVPLLLAPFGAKRIEGEPLPRLILVWAVVGGLIPFIPTVYQVKLLTGWQFPLALLAARAWIHWTAGDASTDGSLRRPVLAGPLASAALLVLVIPTNLYLFAWRFVDLGRYDRPFFLQRDELSALDWLARHTRSTDVVLAPLAVGQFVPSYGRTRAYLAHWAMTNRFFERSKGADRFFDPNQDAGIRRRILDDDGVTFVLATRTEALGAGT
ncbi:MAG: hypothetical protein AB7N65_28425, partial [Vicinamibacterales bacterium]